MASKYSDEYLRKVASGKIPAPNSYVKRIANAVSKGASRSQARGHARVAKGEQKLSVIKGVRSTIKPPKIKPSDRNIKLKNGTQIINTKSTNRVAQVLDQKVKGIGAGKLNRVYFQVWSPSEGKFVNVYYGKPGKKGFHGIAVDEFMSRVHEKMESGEASDLDAAIRDVIAEDSADGEYVESDGDEGVAPFDFSQVRMYIRSV